MLKRSCDILLQTAQPLLGRLQHVVVLADSEAEIVLGDVRIGVGVELGGRDGCHTDFVDQEPAQLEVTRTAGDVRREWVVLRKLHGRHIGKNEVASLGVRVLRARVSSGHRRCRRWGTHGDLEFVKDFAETLHLLLHLSPALVPETDLVRLLEGNGGSLLEGRHTAVADAGVRAGHVLDQVLGADEVSYSPASGVKGLACRADGESALVELGRQGSDSGERNVVEAVVDFVGKDDQVVLHANLSDALQLSAREDLANGVVTMLGQFAA